MLELDFPRTVTIAPYVSKDAHMAVTYGTPITYPACVEYITKYMINFRGASFITSSWVALPPGTPVTVQDKITLPDGSTPYIGSIAEAYDEEAHQVIYIEVYVGKTAPGEFMQ
jgi:hypothetical protein